ncbi:MAG: hypothetical protein IPI98_00600 [Chitinophagaceae bacterium]|nr:hypothetical protein [Chitinophagaceae bacterium]
MKKHMSCQIVGILKSLTMAKPQKKFPGAWFKQGNVGQMAATLWRYGGHRIKTNKRTGKKKTAG